MSCGVMNAFEPGFSLTRTQAKITEREFDDDGDGDGDPDGGGGDDGGDDGGGGDDDDGGGDGDGGGGAEQIPGPVAFFAVFGGAHARFLFPDKSLLLFTAARSLMLVGGPRWQSSPG